MSTFEPRHSWTVTMEEAVAIQQQLRAEVITEDQLGEVRYVAGVDAGFEEEGTVARAAVAVLTFPDLALHEYAIAHRPVTFPYVPGFLSFREIPAVLAALEQLATLPDVLLCDGQGLAHPRRFGLACHLGVLTALPAIGVAKSRFIGQHDPLPEERGAWQPLRDQGELIGAALRTRVKTQPLYVSIGHRLSLERAIEVVLQCTPKYRLPETTRWAHRMASNLIQEGDLPE
ncbi:MAG: deoxyribonuclease V [Ardenticatenales bacterium]|nr:deoxyribonuclease V [Ardenticatenales bacterium]